MDGWITRWYVYVSVGGHMCGGQKSALENWFSPFPLQTCESQKPNSDLATDIFIHWAILPALNDSFSLCIAVLGMTPRLSCMLGKSSANQAAPPAPQVFVLTMLCSTLTFDLPFSWTQTFRLHSPPRIIFQLITFVFRQFPFHNAYQPLSPPPPCHLFSPSSSLQISPALSWPLCLVPHWD